jgi:hypothetical protein
MEFALAIERNRVALLRIVGALFVMLGLTGATGPDRIPRALYRAILSRLRPAESAVRRLIVILAKDIVVKPRPSRSVPKGSIKSKGDTKRPPNFPLFDPRKRFAHQRKPQRKPAKFGPRIWVLGDEPPPLVPTRPESDGLADARRLKDRLEAIMAALKDLPKQAKRLARALARRDKVPSLRLKDPMRPGRAPGYREKITHEVDEVLRECHGLAWDATWNDTS